MLSGRYLRQAVCWVEIKKRVWAGNAPCEDEDGVL
jgi:hypothetical protein